MKDSEASGPRLRTRDPRANPRKSEIRIPKMMLAFIVRRCEVDLGHRPSPAEFAAWANGGNNRERRNLFGRPISELEARVILRHRSRLVSAKGATPEEEYVEAQGWAAAPEGSNVVALRAVPGRNGADAKPPVGRRRRLPR